MKTTCFDQAAVYPPGAARALPPDPDTRRNGERHLPASPLRNRRCLRFGAPHIKLSSMLLPLLAWSFCAGGADAPASSKGSPRTPITIHVSTNPASPEALQQWLRKTWLGSYDQAGAKDPKWDDKARAALSALVENYTTPAEARAQRMDKLSAAFQGAMDAGCTDPLIRNLYLRWSKPGQQLPALERAERAAQIVQDLEGRDYAPAVRFYINLRAAQMMEEAYLEKRVTNWWLRATEVHSKAGKGLCQLLEDAEMPSQEAILAFSAFLHSLEKRNPVLNFYYPFLFQPAFEHWAQNPVMCREESYYWRRYAWAARGTGWASGVSENNFRLFEERLGRAKTALFRSWELDPKDPQTPTDMINVLLGLDEERGEMELWFKRAMKLNTNNYTACRHKLWYLDPRWHGSDEDLLAFGKECVASKAWGGQVPLILADAHKAIQAYNYTQEPERSTYWQRPEVWPDIQASFDRFFQLNPNAADHHQNYAFYAYRCQQWDELHRQLGLMRSTNYTVFGGKAQFERMIQEAAAHPPGKK